MKETELNRLQNELSQRRNNKRENIILDNKFKKYKLILKTIEFLISRMSNTISDKTS